jgi:hypothetical protein
VRRIAGSEVLTRNQLFPGYGALRIGETKPFQWRWRHTTAVAMMLVAGLTAMGINGLLP